MTTVKPHRPLFFDHCGQHVTVEPDGRFIHEDMFLPCLIKNLASAGIDVVEFRRQHGHVPHASVFGFARLADGLAVGGALLVAFDTESGSTYEVRDVGGVMKLACVNSEHSPAAYHVADVKSYSICVGQRPRFTTVNGYDMSFQPVKSMSDGKKLGTLTSATKGAP